MYFCIDFFFNNQRLVWIWEGLSSSTVWGETLIRNPTNDDIYLKRPSVYFNLCVCITHHPVCSESSRLYTDHRYLSPKFLTYNYTAGTLLGLFRPIRIDLVAQDRAWQMFIFPNTKWDPGDIILHSTLFLTSKTLLGINWHIFTELTCLMNKTEQKHII